MDDDGNVLIKRTDKTEVSVLAAVNTGDRRQADRLGRNQGHSLETDRTVALFDMNKFQRMMADNIRKGRRDKREMELQVCIITTRSGGIESLLQCVSTVAFVPGAHTLLDQPCWIIVINIVTLDLLRSSMAHHPGSISTTQARIIFTLL
jgi:hypothetical protein